MNPLPKYCWYTWDWRNDTVTIICGKCKEELKGNKHATKIGDICSKCFNNKSGGKNGNKNKH